MQTGRSSSPGRSAGVLVHLTSLPGPHGCGDLGSPARALLEFLAAAGQRWWQMLPIHPVGHGSSPYSGSSAFAGNPQLISLEDLVADGLLADGDVDTLPSLERVDHARTAELRGAALRKAFSRSRGSREFAQALEELRTRCAFWLPDYALFRAASERFPGQSWTTWEPSLARHESKTCEQLRRAWSESIEYYEFEQLLFDRQWRALRRQAAERGVGLIGDAPIFVAHESADVWAHQTSFRLDAQGQPTHVSGVPPDAFSQSGQRWGTPLYRWKALARTDFPFWVERLSSLLERFELVRLDHFIGFARYWEIPAQAETAIEGRWMKGPGRQLFDVLERELTHRGLLEPNARLPLIAEDLGCVNRSVRTLRERFRLPGMRVMQFGLGEAHGDNEHLPHNYPRRCVAYTGTHDNDTSRAWFEDAGGPESTRTPEQCVEARAAAIAYLAGPAREPAEAELTQGVHLAMIRALFASAAQQVIVPLQDWLGLGGEARMNVPGRPSGNWEFRLTPDSLTPALAQTLRRYTETYRRT
jgi:4-alpha-glucanotransferase